MITDINQLDFNKRYTYADYLTWQFDEMVELLRGKIFRMSPAPNRLHQRISSNLHLEIGAFLRKKPCNLYHAPFDVRLPLPTDKVDTVVQPDLCVICDRSKLDDQGCNGAPDWIIEILSPSTSQKDVTEKFDIYQNAGVQEYWIVHPHEATVLVYHLDENNTYQIARQRPYVRGEFIPVGVFDGFSIEADQIFED